MPAAALVRRSRLEKLPKQQRRHLPSWELVDVIDRACREESFAEYEVQQVAGQIAFVGPGIDAAGDPMPYLDEDDRWLPGRLSIKCQEFAYELVGEEEVYARWKRGQLAAVCAELRTGGRKGGQSICATAGAAAEL